MKKIIFLTLTAIFLALSFSACVNNVEDYSKVVPNIDDKVREVHRLTNEFRKSNDAWYWNDDNATKTNCVGKLGDLILDTNLCKAAQIRSNEIVKNFSHTRPNGKSCFTVYDDIGYKWSAVGENIAAGNGDANKTFLQWKEDEKPYSGQGHRRNMLGSNFTKIGIAYTYDPKSTYRYYWTMVLAR